MSGIKRILVHLDSTDRCALRLALACHIAKRQGARLVGLFAETDPTVPGPIADWPTATHAAAAQSTRDAFAAALAEHGVQGDWYGVHSGQPDQLTQEVLAAARASDLTLLGQHNETHHRTIPAGMVEEIVVGAGTPVLILPYAGTFTMDGHGALVAWNGSREAAHALAGARPLLEMAGKALVLELIPEGRRPPREEAPWSDPTALLAAWGVTAEHERHHVTGIGIMDLLLSRLTDEGAALLVMGAHGHYGFPSLGRGRGTRYILDHMTVPVLMAH